MEPWPCHLQFRSIVLYGSNERIFKWPLCNCRKLQKSWSVRDTVWSIRLILATCWKKKNTLHTESRRTLRNDIPWQGVERGSAVIPLTLARSNGVHCESRKIHRQFHPLSLSSTAIVKGGLALHKQMPAPSWASELRALNKRSPIDIVFQFTTNWPLLPFLSLSLSLPLFSFFLD